MNHTTTNSIHHLRDSCRSCGGRQVQRFLSLGKTPLANAYLQNTSKFSGEPSFPLDVYYCGDCKLIQLLDVIEAECLFGEYLYVTGTSETMQVHNREYADSIVGLAGLSQGDLVVEVASNDGSLLKCFAQHSVDVLGVEPAKNIAAQAQEAGIPTLNRFFNEAAADEIRASHGLAKVVLANNVLAHVDDTPGFLRGCRKLIEPDGMFVFEVPYLRDMIERLEYDTVYHEHLCYFSITALMHLLRAAGLVIRRVDRVAVHGGSIRVHAVCASRDRDHDATVVAMSADEHRDGLTEWSRFEQFAEDVAQHREKLQQMLYSLREQGASLAAYGAPAKGNTLLNYCGIDAHLLRFTVDKNPLKVGLYAPGSHLPIRPVDELTQLQPDYVVILAWNFADEIIRQQRLYRDRGGRFIVPIPEPTII